jgi:hypothetical protein
VCECFADAHRNPRAGFWTWKNLGRSVNAGAKGIRILAPIVGVKRKKDSEAEKDITTQNTRALLGFRNAYVFDRLSRDLRPARVRHLNRTAPVYCAMAAHGHWDYYGDFHCEESF